MQNRTLLVQIQSYVTTSASNQAMSQIKKNNNLYPTSQVILTPGKEGCIKCYKCRGDIPNFKPKSMSPIDLEKLLIEMLEGGRRKGCTGCWSSALICTNCVLEDNFYCHMCIDEMDGAEHRGHSRSTHAFLRSIGEFRHIDDIP